jgi:hypothetical protein
MVDYTIVLVSRDTNVTTFLSFEFANSSLGEAMAVIVLILHPSKQLLFRLRKYSHGRG